MENMIIKKLVHDISQDRSDPRYANVRLPPPGRPDAASQGFVFWGGGVPFPLSGILNPETGLQGWKSLWAGGGGGVQS